VLKQVKKAIRVCRIPTVASARFGFRSTAAGRVANHLAAAFPPWALQSEPSANGQPANEWLGLGIKARIARPGTETSQKLGRHRWVIERSFAWLNRFRRLTIRYDSDSKWPLRGMGFVLA